MNPEEQALLLARIDERVNTLLNDFEDLRDSLDARYVAKADFQAVKLITFGMVGGVLMAFMTSLVNSVLK